MRYEERHVGGVIYRTVHDIIQFLIQPVESLVPQFAGQGILQKFPGGSNKGHQEKDPIDTLRRELREELWLKLKPGFEPIHIYGPVPHEYPRMFFLLPIEALEGRLRYIPTIDGTDLLYVPKWVSKEELDANPEFLFESHKDVYKAALLRFARQEIFA